MTEREQFMSDMAIRVGRVEDALEQLCNDLDLAVTNIKRCMNYRKEPQQRQSKPQPSSDSQKTFSGDTGFLPPETREYVRDVKEHQDYYEVKLQFVSGGKFAELSEELKSIGGEYVSAGKDTHWRIPKTPT